MFWLNQNNMHWHERNNKPLNDCHLLQKQNHCTKSMTRWERSNETYLCERSKSWWRASTPCPTLFIVTVITEFTIVLELTTHADCRLKRRRCHSYRLTADWFPKAERKCYSTTACNEMSWTIMQTPKRWYSKGVTSPGKPTRLCTEVFDTPLIRLEQNTCCVCKGSHCDKCH